MKSTLLGSWATQLDGTFLDFDDDEQLLAYRDDLQHVISGPKPILIDEYQRLPEVLQAIKAELNRDGRAGQYLLTGSARHESLPRTAQALTGRLHRMDVYPLSQPEIRGTEGKLLKHLFEDFDGCEVERESGTTREAYVNAIVSGGLPPALNRESTPHETAGWMTTSASLWNEMLSNSQRFARPRHCLAFSPALRSLTNLRDAVGEAFIGGVLLNLGRYSSQPNDRIRVMPVDQLWGR